MADKKPRKKRSDSTAFAVEVARHAGEVLQPPAHARLDEGAEPYYEEIVNGKERSLWTPLDLTLAVRLANTFLLIDQIDDRLKADGLTVLGGAGGVKSHPLLATREAAMRQIVATLRLLQVHSLATNGVSDRQATRNTDAVVIKDQVAAAHDTDNLIPRLRVVNG